MKKTNLALLLCLMASFTSKAQIYELISHLGGWSGSVNGCQYGSVCNTYDYLCVHSGCAPWAPIVPGWPGTLWSRIGTPSQAGIGFVDLHSRSSAVEGLFTDVYFVSNETYYIHVGVNRTSFSAAYPTVDEAKIQLFATTDLEQTLMTPNSQPVCCSEPSLWNSGSFNAGYWQVNNNQYDNTDGILIGEFRPGWIGGTTKAFTVPYTVSPGTAFNQFALHPNYEGAGQFNAILDYIIIEKDCGANFTHSINTALPYIVQFDAVSNIPGNSYAWSDGFMNVFNEFGPSRIKNYALNWPFFLPVTTCLEVRNEEGMLVCIECRELCDLGITWKSGNCEVVSDFTLDVFGLYTNKVRISNPPFGADYVVDWGDGNITHNPSTPEDWIHQYDQQGTYDVCLKVLWDEYNANGERCFGETCMKFCVNDGEFNPAGVDEWDEYHYQLGTGEKRTSIATSTTEHSIPKIQGGIVGEGIKISPNPVTSFATIEIGSAINGIATVSLHDVMGKEISTQSTNIGAGLTNVRVDMSSVPAGVYFIQVNDGSRINRSKVVKQ